MWRINASNSYFQVPKSVSDIPIWNFDGSSCYQVFLLSLLLCFFCFSHILHPDVSASASHFVHLPGWGQQLRHLSPPCEDVQGSIQGRSQYHGRSQMTNAREMANAISGDVRNLQVQQGADGEQQQKSMQWGVTIIIEMVSKSNIARGTTDPGYCLFNLSIALVAKMATRWNICIIANLATRWRNLYYLQYLPPDGTICISCKFDHKMAPLA